MVLGRGRFALVPSPEDGQEIFLDVMGMPPRVGSFDEALAGSRDIETRWGTLHTVGIKHLVELKKTQRPRDYPIISRLALAWLDERAAAASADDLAWVIENLFSLPELVRLFIEHPELVSQHALLTVWCEAGRFSARRKRHCCRL